MKRLVLDSETSLNHQTIHLVCTEDIDTGEKKTWTQAEALREYLKDATLIIGQNIVGFDAPILKSIWKITIPTTLCFDTLIVSRLLDPSRESGHSLESWGKTLGDEKIDYAKIWEWMNDRHQSYRGECFDFPIFGLLEWYCAQDVSVTAKLYRLLSDKLKELQFSDQSVQLEHDIADILEQCKTNGFRLDVQHATMLLVDITGRLDAVSTAMQERWPPRVYERISEKTGKKLADGVDTFNPGSRKQIGEKLIEAGWVPDKFTPTGQPVVDEEVLEKSTIPEAKLIAEYLLCQKRIAQIRSWMDLVDSDGRVHGTTQHIGAITNRCSHSSPNMGQVPNTSSLYGKECRQSWTVDNNNVLVGVDLSGIELRCLAHYMQDAKWQKELLEGDVHWANTQAFGLVPMGTKKEDIKEHKDARNLSKTLIYAMLYGAGDAKVGKICGGNATKGRKLKDSFLKHTPSLVRLQKKLEPYIAKGFVPGLDGRKIWIRSEHAALNSLLQSAGAIVAKKWLKTLTDDLKAANIPFKLVAFVHDEVQIETLERFGDEVGKIAVEAAAKAGELLKFRCPVAAEYRTGRNWYDTH